jgi:hypothetical protein
MRSFPTVILDLPRQEYTCDSACSVETMKPLNWYKAQLGGEGKWGEAGGGEAKARERGKMGGAKPRSLSLAFTPWLLPPPPLTAPGCLSIVDSIAINGYRAAVQIPEEFESSSRQRIFRCSLVELGDRWKLE